MSNLHFYDLHTSSYNWGNITIMPMLSEVMCVKRSIQFKVSREIHRTQDAHQREVYKIWVHHRLIVFKLNIKDPYEKCFLAAPAMLPTSIADLITCRHF